MLVATTASGLREMWLPKTELDSGLSVLRPRPKPKVKGPRLRPRSLLVGSRLKPRLKERYNYKYTLEMPSNA